MVLERYRINNKGFTLVELMTVVAIIGALAALGVPQYRKMQRKAKRAEASMALGVIASAEASFFAEYNGYGDNMGGIGAEMDNAPQYYNVGFLGTAAPHEPLTGTSYVPKFCENNFACVSGNPRTFTGYSGSRMNFPKSDFAQYDQVVASGFQAMQPNGTTAWEKLKTAGGGACPASVIGANNAPTSTAGANDAGFRALAAGNLYWNTATTTRYDCVSIDKQRTITLVQDGT